MTGDTKVVERGRADGVYITTSGVGTFDGPWRRPPQRVLPGDSLLVSGPIASHGLAVMAAREKLDFDPPIQSDARPLASLIRSVLETGIPVHAMRDPTRGGLGATLCEWAEESAVDLTVREEALPVREDVRAACGLAVAPSLWEETFGMVVLESWLHGTPVIVTPRGGLPELISHGRNGWIAWEPSADALAETLRTALEEEERWPSMGAHGQQLLSSTYSPAAWLQSMGSLLEELRLFRQSPNIAAS